MGRGPRAALAAGLSTASRRQLVGAGAHVVPSWMLAIRWSPLRCGLACKQGGEGVTHAEVLEVFAANVTRLRELVEKIVEGLPAGRDCPCPDALDGIKLSFELPG